MADRTNNNIPINSVSRAAQILDVFTNGRTNLDLSTITELTGFSRATAHRYCVSLREVGMLRYSPDRGTYGVGARLIELGSIAVQDHPIVALADPYLQELVTDLDFTVVMTVWDGFAPVIARVNDNTAGNVRISVRVGTRLPVFGSAQGHLYLAFSERIRRQYEHLGSLELVRPDLEGVRRRGFTTRSLSVGLLTVAAPLIAHKDDTLGTIAVVGTTDALADLAEGRVAKRLQMTAEQLSKDWEALSAADKS